MEEELKFGDIIIAHRYQNSCEKKKIKNGHRVGPFIVIGKNDNKYTCIYGTTKSEYKDSHDALEVDINRMTYFVLDYIYDINESAIGVKIDSLDERQKEILMYKLKKESLENKEISVGDIINYKDNTYYVKTIKPYTLVKVDEKGPSKLKSFSIFRKKYFFDTSSIIVCDNIESCKIVDFLDNVQVSFLTDCFNSKELMMLDRGMLIKYLTRMYYVYGIEKDDVLLYEVTDSTPDSVDVSLLINGKEYSASFETLLKINKNSFYVPIDKATDNEMKTNRIKKKKYLKEHNNNISPLISDYIISCKIVQDRSAAKVKYLVLSREGTSLVLIALEDIENCNYRAITIRDISAVTLCDRYNEENFFDIIYNVSQYNDWFISKEDKKKIKERKKRENNY